MDWGFINEQCREEERLLEGGKGQSGQKGFESGVFRPVHLRITEYVGRECIFNFLKFVFSHERKVDAN